MPEEMRRRIGSVALTLGLVVTMLILMLTALHAVGTDDGLYYREQKAAGTLPQSGLTEQDLRTLDGCLADYLAGDAAALYAPVARVQVTVGGGSAQVHAPVMSMDVFGQSQPVFNEREMAHMADCYRLFALLRKVRGRLIPWAIVLVLGGAWMLRDRRRIRLCAWLSPLIVLLPLGAFAVYAVSDFDAAFTLFHKVLFSNDLWLLDPRTDLLIRICPASMFMHMGVRIAVYSLIGILAVSAAAMLLTFIWPRGKEENAWKTTTRRGPAPKQITFGNRGTR